ncbi:YgaP family membrane protein [Sutcliffiella halmapala]
MKPNIGIINALIRLTAGFTILAWIISKMVRRPYRDSYILVALLAAMKIGEGILKYCPITDLFERYQGNRAHKDDFDFGDDSGDSHKNESSSNKDFKKTADEFDLDFDDLRQQLEGDGDGTGASSYNPS